MNYRKQGTELYFLASTAKITHIYWYWGEVPLTFVSSAFTQLNANHSELKNELLKNEAVIFNDCINLSLIVFNIY